MRYVAGPGAYSPDGAIDPMVVVEVVDPPGRITQVWPYDGDDPSHVQHAAYLTVACQQMPDLSLGQFARLVAGDGILLNWESFAADVLIHPAGPWE